VALEGFYKKLDILKVYADKVFGNFWYIIGVNLLIFIAWATQLFYLGFFAVVLIFIISMLTQKNINALLPVFISAVYMVSAYGNVGGVMVRPAFADGFFTVLFICLPFLLASLVLFFVKNKFKFGYGGLTVGLLVFFVAAQFGGIGFAALNLSNIFKLTAFYAAIFCAYLLFFNTVDTKAENFKIVICRSFLYCGLLVVAEIFFAYIRSGDFTNYFLNESINLGWGIGPTAGQVLNTCLPFIFYLLAKSQKRYGVIVYNAAIFFILAALFLTLSRNGMLVCLIVIVPLYVLSAIKTKKENKKILYLGAAGVVAAFLAIYLSDTGYFNNMLTKALKELSDRGRYALYEEGLKDFVENIIFGKSLFYKEQGFIFMYWYHNTFIQILANLGLVGMAAFLFFMFKKYVVFLKRGDVLKFFIFFSLLMTEMQGMLDMHIIDLRYSIFMVLMVAVAEKLTDSPEKYWLRLKRKKTEKGVSAV
jgi:hypothetical protein